MLELLNASKIIKPKSKIKLINIKSRNLNLKFKIFYKFRFNSDFLKNNIDKKKYQKAESYIWFKKNHKKKIIFTINYKKKIIGLIIYNINNFYYSIIISKIFRNKNFGKTAIIKFIKYLKKKNFKLKTLVRKNNIKSVSLHDKICIIKKNYDKNFFLYKII
jgi:hypothetical protein